MGYANEILYPTSYVSPFWKVLAIGYLVADTKIPVVPPLTLLVSNAAPVTFTTEAVAKVNSAALAKLSMEAMAVLEGGVHAMRVGLVYPSVMLTISEAADAKLDADQFSAGVADPLNRAR